jgi:terminase large subunit-like protein
MVRRTRTELLETHERARVVYGKIGAKFSYQPMRAVMPGGGRLTFAYLERDADAERYQGGSFSRIYIEEVGNFPSPTPILKLMATLRSGAGVPVGMRLTGNPGGSGHHWVRARYIDPAPRGWKIITDPDTGLERMYIPSRVTDNKYLGEDYIQRLKATGTPELVRAWLYGDWTVIAGSFFPEFSSDRHIIPPRALPEHWARFRSFDWGSARPFAVHWWAVSDGSLPDIARGCLVNYREFYGMRPGEPNVGLRMTAEQVAEGIRDRERDDPKPKDGGFVGVADPSIFAEDGGPSIASRMTRAARIVFRPADNKRVPQRGAMGGWDQVRARLVGDADDKPMVVFFSTSIHVIRTLPILQHDPARPEDCDTDSEDHCCDSVRYSVMSRPYVRDLEHKPVRDSWDAAFNRDDGELRDWRVA